MGRTIRFLYTIGLILASSTGVFSQPIIVGTYNLRYDNPGDSGNLWKDRLPVVASLIQFNKFDILGTQEGLENQLEDLSARMPEYERYGVGRDDGKQAGEHSAIFFRKERFELMDSGDFWLSETPGKPSKGWDAKCCNRLCSWVHLRDKDMNTKTITVYNVHFDHQGVKAREESARLVDSMIRRKTGFADVILMGDFNGGRHSDAYEAIDQNWIPDTYRKAAIIHEHNPSFNNFGRNLESAEVIDHIFVSNTFRVSRWGIIGDSYHGKYPSDHFPVLTELEYKIERN